MQHSRDTHALAISDPFPPGIRPTLLAAQLCSATPHCLGAHERKLATALPANFNSPGPPFRWPSRRRR